MWQAVALTVSEGGALSCSPTLLCQIPLALLLLLLGLAASTAPVVFGLSWGVDAAVTARTPTADARTRTNAVTEGSRGLLGLRCNSSGVNTIHQLAWPARAGRMLAISGTGETVTSMNTRLLQAAACCTVRGCTAADGADCRWIDAIISIVL